MKSDIVCRPVDVIYNIKICAEAPSYCYRAWGAKSRTEELLQIEENLNRWMNEFKDFLRDHRSQDMIELSIEREHKTVCSACGNEWEGTDKDELGEFCTCCGAYAKINAEIWQQIA